nr:PBSX family phage terminase large subunit [Ihubacter massiliensis]
MDTKKGDVEKIIDKCLAALQDEKKIQKAGLMQTATTLGIVIDKFTEQKVKVSKARVEIEKLKPQGEEEKEYAGIPATMIIPKFAPVVFSIENNEYLEYVFPGGRGSTKSSFVSLMVIDLIMKNPELHAVVGRQVADTLRTSVYQQMVWAIEALGLSDEFKCGISPLEITRKSTGQKIYFRGADDPGKFKSIKVPFGYIGVLWLEELDQFVGPEAVRKIEQSVIRGGDKAYIFKSFNPPKTASNWANKYVKMPKENRLVTESNYLDVPPAWLGKPFIDEAEFLKLVNPTAYENEYMGVANGTGGMVFDNVTIREITNQEIARMDRIYRGVDWGWYPDPWAYNAVYYYAAEHRLYVIDEDEKRRTKNEETARILKEEHGLKPNDKVVCDSAEEKSTADYKDFGIFARNAIKGPGSVDYSMKWLQSLSEIVIDNRRTPHTAEEFLNYEYDRDKDDQVISGYPDRDNHHIDAIRYAMEEVWRRRGQ